MSAGTLALTNGSTAVTGSGTVFQTDLAPNDFIVCKIGGTTYTLGVSTIGSNTALTLTQPFTGPTTSGVAWYAVPNQTLVGITTELAANLTSVYRSVLVNDANWTKVFSQSGNITVTLKDGSTFTGPSWNSINTTLGNKLDKSQNLNDLANKTTARTNLGWVSDALPLTLGGTGGNNGGQGWLNLLNARTAATARNDLGLGNAATRTVSEGLGYPNDVVLGRGAFGLGGVTAPNGVNDGRYNEFSGFYAGPGASGTNYFDAYAPMLVMSRYQSVLGMMQISPSSGRSAVRGRSGDTFTNWLEIYTTGNTTKASDGTLKAASPIARIVKSQDSTTRADVAEAGFAWCGCGTSNEEAEGISISRLETGVYVLTGSAGLASEGWQLLPPRDPQGSGDLGIVEAEETDSGGLTIRLYKRRYKLSDNGDIEVVKGALIDVPVNSWIDVRLDMPADSAYNLKQAQLQKVVAQEGSGQQAAAEDLGSTS